MNKKIIKLTKKIISLVMICSMTFNIFDNTFALDAFSNKEVDSPVAEANNNISQGIIIDKNKIEAINPLNPTPQIQNLDEINKVNSYVVDIDTIELRVKHFSPTYMYAKSTAANTMIKSLYQAGGSVDNIQTLRDTQQELPTSKKSLQKNYNTYSNQLSSLKNAGLTDNDPRVMALSSAIAQISAGIQTINVTTGTLNSAVSGYTKVLRLVGNIDNNASIEMIRMQITKAMINAILSYKQLELATDLFSKQYEYSKKNYDYAVSNMELGLITGNEFVAQKQVLDNAKKSYEQYSSLLKNTKEIIALNLGYPITDVDKLYIKEPEINYTYLYSIVPGENYERAINSNSTYSSIRDAGINNKKLPASTGQQVYDKLLSATSEKISSQLDYLYQQVNIQKLKFDASSLESEILNHSKAATERKKEENLVSDVQYLGLKLQDQSTAMNIKVAKYNLIKAMNDYYYATYGILTID